jgi:hypothetical protein
MLQLALVLVLVLVLALLLYDGARTIGRVVTAGQQRLEKAAEAARLSNPPKAHPTEVDREDAPHLLPYTYMQCDGSGGLRQRAAVKRPQSPTQAATIVHCYAKVVLQSKNRLGF